MTDIAWTEEEDLDIQINEAQKLLRSLKDKKWSAIRSATRKCHWCGKTDDDNYDEGYGGLVDFHLTVADGEEGFSNVVRYACQDHLEWLQEEFNKLGFTNHSHGGTCFLEDTSCVGSTYNEKHYLNECPTPEDIWEIKVWPM